MSEEIKALSDEELETVSGGGIESYDAEHDVYIGRSSGICPNCDTENLESLGGDLCYCGHCKFVCYVVERRIYDKLTAEDFERIARNVERARKN